MGRVSKSSEPYAHLLEQLQASLDRIGDACLALDKDLKFVFANSSTATLLNSIKEDLMLQRPPVTDFAFFHPIIIAAYQRALDTQKPQFLEWHAAATNSWYAHRIYPDPNGISVFIQPSINYEQTDQARKDSIASMQKLMDELPLGLLLADVETKSFVYANQAICQLFGYTPEEFMHLNPVLLHPEYESVEVMEVFNNMLEERTSEIHHLDALHKNGQIFTVNISAAMVMYNGRKCISGLFKDVTEQKQLAALALKAKASIETSEVLMRQANDIANMGYWEIQHDHYEITWSDTTCKIFEVDATTFKPSHISFISFIHPDDVALVETAFTNHIEHRMSFNVVFRIYTASNQLKYLHEKCRTEYDTNGKPIRTIGMVMDITKQKKAELALRAEQQQYQTLFDYSPVGMVSISKDLQYFFGNKKFQALTGYQPNDIETLNDWWQVAYPDTATRKKTQKFWETLIQAAEHHKKTIPSSETMVTCKNGETKYFEIGYVLTEKHHLLSFVDITERKKAEADLAENEAKFRRIADQMTDMVWIGDLNYKASYVSPSVEKIYGLTPEEYFNYPLEKRFPQHSIDTFKNIHRTLLAELKENPAPQSREITLEIEAFKKDGTPIWVQSITKILCDEKLQPIGIMGVSSNITARKKAEEALTQSEARYKTLFQGSPVGILVTGPQNELLLGNSTFTAMTGYDYTEVAQPEAWWQLAYPDEAYRNEISKKWLKSIEIARQTNCPIDTFEALITCKNGEAQYFQLGYMPGKDINIISFTNIHELRVAQQTIARANANLHNMMQNLPQGIAIIDTAVQQFQFVNPSMCSLFGYTADELMQLGPIDLHPAYEHDRVLNHIELLREGINDGMLQADVVNKEGKIFKVEITPLYVEYNGKKATAGVFTDITEKVAAIHALQSAKDKAEENELLLKHAQRIGSMGSWTFDYVTNELNWSDAVFEILGLLPNSIVPTYTFYLSMIHPDDRSKLDDAYKMHVSQNAVYDIRHRVILQDGSIKHIHATAVTDFDIHTGKPIYTIGIMTDISKQVQAEQALVEAKKEAEARELILQEVQQIAQTGYWEHNHTTGKVSWSEDIYHFFGLNPFDAAPDYNSFFKYLNAEDTQRVHTAYQQSLEQRLPFDITHRITTKNGEEKFLHQRCVTFFDSDGQPIKSVGVVADVTASEKATEEIREQKNYIESLLQAIPDLLFVLNTEGIYTTFKSSSTENLLMPSSQFVGKHYKDVLPTDLAVALEDVLATTRKNGATESWQYDITLDGETKYFDAKLQLMGNGSILSLSRDVTASKKASLLIEESEVKYRSVFEATPVGLVALDEAENILVSNKHFGVLTGYSDDDMPSINVWWQTAFPDEAYREEVFHIWKNAAAQSKTMNGDLPPIEVAIQCKHKGKRIFEVGIVYSGGIHLVSFNDIHEKRLAQSELIVSETRFRQIAETVEEVFWLHTADLKKLLYINPAYEKVFGSSLEDLDKGEKFILKAIHPDDAPSVIAGYYEYLRTFQFDMEYRIVLPTGEVRWIRNKSLPVKDEEGTIVAHAGTAEDITQKKLALTKLKEQEAFQHLLMMLATEFINSPTDQFDVLMNSMLEKVGIATKTDRVYIFEHDNAHATTSNTYEWCATGVSSEIQKLQQQPLSLYSSVLKAHKAGEVYHLPDIETIRSNRDFYEHLQVQQIKSAVVLPLTHNNEIIGTIGFDAVKEARTFKETEIQLLQVLAEIVTNGLLRKEAEILLRKNEERLVQLTKLSHTFAWEIDANGLFTYVSNVVTDVLGYTPEELVGKWHYYDLHPVDSRENFIAITMAVFQNHETFNGLENIAVHKNGQEVWLAISGTPVIDELGKLIGYRGGDTDITHRKKMELAVIKSEASYRLLADNSTDVIWIYDIGDNSLKYASPGCIELHGFTVAESLSMSIEETMTPASFSLIMQKIKENTELYQSSGIMPPSQMLEIQQYHKNGSIVWVEIVAKLQLSADNQLQVLGVSRNITERKKAELEKLHSQEALRESESRLEAIIETTSDSIWSINTNYEILYTNGVFKQSFEHGFNTQLHKGDNILSKLPANLQDSWKSKYDLVLQQQIRNTFEDYFDFATGPIWVEVSMFPIIDNGEVTGVSCFGKDVTIQKIAELGLAESEQRFRTMFKDNASVMFLIDPDNGNIIDSNYAAEKFYGWPEEIFRKLQLTDICLHPDKALKNLNDAKENKNVRYEILHRLSNGTVCEMEVFSSLITINGRQIIHEIIHDVSAKKRAESDLIEKNKQLNLLIQSIPGVVFNCINNDDDRMNFINEYIFEITGYTAQEINDTTTIHYRKLIHPEDLPKFDFAVAEAYQQRKRYNFSYRLLNKDGGFRWVYEIGEFQSYEGPARNKRIDGIIFDITNRITNEEMKLSAAFEAAEAERTRISHEIHDGIQQTLVASKLSIASLRKEIDLIGGRTLEKFNTGIQLIDQGIQEARSIAHSLMPKQVNDYGYNIAVQHLISNLEQKIEIEFNHPNLMLNDNKFGTNLFRITQEAVNNILKHAEATKIKITLLEAGNRLVLTIQDNGKGFDKMDINSPDKGIGMQIMASRAAAMNAIFDVATAKGMGTTIIIDVPYE